MTAHTPAPFDIGSAILGCRDALRESAKDSRCHGFTGALYDLHADEAEKALDQLARNMNGWDALVAERDALKAVVFGFVEYGFDCQCEKDETGPQEHADTCHIVVARRLLSRLDGKGGM